MRWTGLLLLLVLPAAWANHPWGEVDICTTRNDIMPPGLVAPPEPDSRGARLLQRYCTQCHNLPGAGRHTAGEWPPLLERMETLMGVSRFYRGLLGPVAMPDEGEWAELRDYLQRHALQPLPASPTLAVTPAERIYRTVCGDCHAAPDPRRYDDWPRLLDRMARHRDTMGRAPLPPGVQRRVLAFIEAADDGPRVSASGHAATALPLADGALLDDDPVGRGLSLVAFFGLTLLGAWRWRRAG